MECPLKLMREVKGDSREKVSQFLRVNHTTVFRWEKNVMMPSAENFLQLAGYLEMPVEEAIRMWLEWSKSEKGETIEQIINS